ncbi:Crp/Fnr family transcriptional regulator [Aquimarina algiphila]|uniref:Crp/Fnr family transcriptional regulator n=1 Tax=Aquimarina algiphila TaxID=2047982 RepID=UPI00232AD4C9|nr:Crp/Fnr family transcriptional regulator [Aquimarina algiphila]
MKEEYLSFKNHINKRILLSENEMRTFISAFKLKKVRKRQFIIQPDFTATYRNYVLNGALRAYVINDEGQESTIQFAIEDWWITDYNSYIYQKPATMFVMAVEESILLQIDYDTEQRLKHSNPNFEIFFRIMAERSTAYMQRRVIENITLTAKERYEKFLLKYSDFSQRFPQYAIASYLGMSTEFLSRIKNNKL